MCFQQGWAGLGCAGVLVAHREEEDHEASKIIIQDL